MIAENKFIELFKQSPLKLDSGQTLSNIQVSYQTYGQLNKDKTNVVLVCHALSGSAHAAFKNQNNVVGWWDFLIGPGKAIDTKKYFVISSNSLGSCNGTTGPRTKKTASNEKYGLQFPVITIADMVKVQRELLNKLEIKSLECVIGGSMGGMQTLEWVRMYPDFIKKCIPIASALVLPVKALAFNSVGRQAILSDSDWNNGQYNDESPPHRGLAVARMIGHITYLSEISMNKKFGRKLQEKSDYGYDFSTDFQLESYLLHQGDKFVNKFDPMSYLYLAKAMSYFDLDKPKGTFAKKFKKTNAHFLVVSFSSDWLYPPESSQELAVELMKLGKNVSYCNIDSDFGHDSFLIQNDDFESVVKGFLK